MKFTLPRVPLWLVVAVAALVGAAAVVGDFLSPRAGYGGDVSDQAGFFAAAGFAAAFVALAGGRIVRLLRKRVGGET